MLSGKITFCRRQSSPSSSHGSMRTPQSGHTTPATSLPLSAIRVNCFVRPVTVRLSLFTGMDMPKALPDLPWHSLQWQAAKRIGSANT
jgi:hypothetical protein